jgi:ATP-dependent helicase/nuclease subunit B
VLISALKVFMKTVVGPFHPHLESALVDEVHARKSINPLSALLILVPSDSLRRRLKTCFAGEKRMNLLNVHLLTFHQLYLRLYEEDRRKSRLLPADDFILQEALGYWIKTGGSKTATLFSVAEKAGGCGTLWQTLRDLKDGGVKPASLVSALEEGLFDGRDKERLVPLIALYESFNESCAGSGLRDYTDFLDSVRQLISGSAFLNQFERLFYYGFYDLTQVQIDLFYEIACHYPTTVMFPLAHDHPGWIFAQRFYERYLQGVASEEEYLCRPDNPSCCIPLFWEQALSATAQTVEHPSCAVISCSGPRDEILTTAKEILRLNRDEELAFSEIGVVARTLEPYTDWIKEVFRDHRIPIFTSGEEPLLRSSLAKAVNLLLELPAKDYLRSQLVDLVSSPFFNLCAVSVQPWAARSDLWDVLTRRLGIARGFDEWSRLKRYLDRDLELGAGVTEDDETRKVSVASEQVEILWRMFTELHHDLSGLPVEASWKEYVETWTALLQKYLNLKDGEALPAEAPDQAIKATISEILSALSTLDAVSSRISLTQFVHTFQRSLEAKLIPISDRNVDGVVVLDAMAARGSRFQALFVLGLNEGLFPRTIREDAFLRDRTRRTIETVLGYKVNEKLAAFDEEKLLFSLLTQAASKRLYCLYHRSDDTGRVFEPSWYLTELERALSVLNIEVAKTMIPRSTREKGDVDPFRFSDFLLPEELAIRLSLQGEDPELFLSYFPSTKALYESGSKLLALLENTKGKLSQYDGITGHLPEYWRDLWDQGLAPTALERYARCPFQFFASNVLDLRPLKRPEEQSVIDSSERGKLVHDVLKLFFQRLIDAGFFNGSNQSVDPRTLLESAARRVFRDYEAQKPVGYKIVWELLQEEIIALLREETCRDLAELIRLGRRPVALELKLKGQLPKHWPVPAAGLPIQGAIDRIDFNETDGCYRVIDYKFTMRNRPSTSDNNLRVAAVRGEKLQPPMYLLLTKEFAERERTKPTAFEAAFYYLAPRWDDGPFLQKTFSADDLEGSCGKSLRETVALLIRGIHDGLYFIHPGEACRNCEVAHVCRKNHLPTSWRTANDPLSRRHDEAARKTIPDD